MKSWHVSSSKDGYKFHATEYSAFRNAIDEAHGWVCWATHGWLGGHGLPELFFKIPVGKAVRDEDGFLDNSIAIKLYAAEQRLSNWAYAKETTRFSHPISEELAEELAPELVKLIKEIYEED